MALYLNIRTQSWMGECVMALYLNIRLGNDHGPLPEKGQFPEPPLSTVPSWWTVRSQ